MVNYVLPILRSSGCYFFLIFNRFVLLFADKETQLQYPSAVRRNLQLMLCFCIVIKTQFNLFRRISNWSFIRVGNDDSVVCVYIVFYWSRQSSSWITVGMQNYRLVPKVGRKHEVSIIYILLQIKRWSMDGNYAASKKCTSLCLKPGQDVK